MKSCSHPLLSFQADQNSPGGLGIVFSGSQHCCSRKAMFLVQLGAQSSHKVRDLCLEMDSLQWLAKAEHTDGWTDWECSSING